MRTRVFGAGVSAMLCALLGLVLWGGGGPVAAAPGDPSSNYFANLGGGGEVPIRATPATGMATFHISPDGQSVDYSIVMYNIPNVFQGHIHIGAPGTSGPVVVTLFTGKPGSGPQTLNYTGRFTAADLDGPLKGQPLSALTSQLATNSYVNFHTNDGVMPADTGPGDFPGGELRGTMQSADARSIRP